MGLSPWILLRAPITRKISKGLSVAFWTRWMSSLAPGLSSWWIIVGSTSPKISWIWFMNGDVLCLSIIITCSKTLMGMRCEFLSPYSPDYNPLELAFSAIKAEFHHCLPALECDTTIRNEYEVILTIHNSVFSVTSEDAHGWFRRCSYG